jgi:GTP-binding protein
MMSDVRKGEARFLAGVARPNGYPPPDGPEVVFSGRSNVGKSSLLNALLRRKGLARVSKSPGRTQQVNFFSTADLGTFVDLPGYGFARVPEKVREQWKKLIEAYLYGKRPVAMCLLLVDARHEPSRLDVQMHDWLRESGLPFRVVLTKADAVKSAARAGSFRRAAETLGLEGENQAPMPVSIRTGKGLDKVRALIHQVVNE